MTVYLWDLSNHDWDRRPVNLAEARKAGISGVTHKATEGNWYRDPYLDDFTRQLASVPFPVAGTYGVVNHGIDPVAQADYWFAYVDAAYPAWRKHPCWIWQIDTEPLDGYAAATKAEVLAFGQRIEKLSGATPKKIPTYGPEWVYGASLTGLPFPLWASAYGNNTAAPYKANAPADNDSRWHAYSGQVPFALQFGSANVIGGQHTCDVSAVRVADEAALVAAFGGGSTDPMEDVMAMYKDKAEFEASMAKVVAQAVNDRIDNLLEDYDGTPSRIRTFVRRIGPKGYVEPTAHPKQDDK